MVHASLKATLFRRRQGCSALTRVPSDNVVDADAEVRKEPQQNDWRKHVAELARPKPLKKKEEHQDRARDPDHPSCSRHCRTERVTCMQPVGGTWDMAAVNLTH